MRGGATLIAPHGQPPIVVAGDPGRAVVHRTLQGGTDWLRIDFAARTARPMLLLDESVAHRAFFPTALDSVEVRPAPMPIDLGRTARPIMNAALPVH
ncbi:MAG: hypothetical protein U0470_01205 [Anaerolineae bacterium]